MDNKKAANARYVGPMTEAVAQELRALLARHKYSATRLSREANLAKSTLHKTLNARRAIDVEDVFEICEFLGVDPGPLLDAAAAVARKELEDGLLPGEREGMPANFDAAPDVVAEQSAFDASNVSRLDDHRATPADDQLAAASETSEDRGEDGDHDG